MCYYYCYFGCKILCLESFAYFLNYYFFRILFIYLFLEGVERRGKERERNISVWLPLTHPYWGPGPQPRHVPWLGIEPTTLWFAGLPSIHRATPATVLVSSSDGDPPL